MKITVVCDILGKEDNGTTIATMNFIRHLQKNHDVTILCCDPTKKDLPNYYVVGTKKFPGAIGRFVESTGFALAKPDKRIVEKAVAGADIVHCFEPFALSMAAIKCAKRHHIPVTAALHLLPEHLTYYVNISKV
ncbi:MAG: glycosyltransferase [Mycoplasmoidaceae bacterium]|nr:glycosyltransferase [Mycoplasmoidaceae bacterium]